MAGIGLSGILEAYSIVIHALIYLALFIFIIKAKSSIERLHLIIVVIGFFMLAPQGDILRRLSIYGKGAW